MYFTNTNTFYRFAYFNNNSSIENKGAILMNVNLRNQGYGEHLLTRLEYPVSFCILFWMYINKKVLFHTHK